MPSLALLAHCSYFHQRKLPGSHSKGRLLCLWRERTASARFPFKPLLGSALRVWKCLALSAGELRIPREGGFQQPQDVYINDQVICARAMFRQQPSRELLSRNTDSSWIFQRSCSSRL